MPSSIDYLLPATDSSPRCAPFNRSLGVDPGGTSIAADLVLLVETPLPWPKPAVGHPIPAGLIAGLAAGGEQGKRSRVLSTVPGAITGVKDSSVIGVVAFRRSARSTLVAEFRAEDETELAALGERLGAELINPSIDTTSYETMTDQVIVICTQGSHDVCCGSEGARLAEELENNLIPGLNVYRVSHTGGHRFAPTAMTLPDGRMWANLNRASVEAILARDALSADQIGNCRGWWGVPTGPAQLAERAVFAKLGWAVDSAARQVNVLDNQSPDGDSTVEVLVDDKPWTVMVSPVREVPTIACRQEGGLPAKTATEYTVTSLKPPTSNTHPGGM